MNEQNNNTTPPQLIYNVTTQVTWAAHDAWLSWMLDEYIPAILGTGCFIRHQFVRLLQADETDGPIYAVQYYAANKAVFDNYTNLYQQAFAALEQDKWGGAAFSFSSLMQVVN